MNEETTASQFGEAAPRASSATAANQEVSAGIYESVRRFVEAVRDNFTVRNVFGEPIEAHGVTVVPVAQTYFGFGGGGGGGSAPHEQSGSGGGGGAGGVVRPIGFIEITSAGARWVPITRPWQRVAVGVVPPLMALMVGRAIRQRRMRRALLRAG